MLLASCGAPSKPPVVLPAERVACIDEPHPKFPGLPGAHDCPDHEVCLPRADWKALLDYLAQIRDWANKYETLCKE